MWNDEFCKKICIAAHFTVNILYIHQSKDGYHVLSYFHLDASQQPLKTLAKLSIVSYEFYQ